MASATGETPSWVPGAVVPLEPVSLRWVGTATTRWVVHAISLGGMPSHDLELAAMNGRARVLVVSGACAAYPMPVDQRHRALQLITTLPTTQRWSTHQRRALYSAWHEPSVWSAAALVLDGKPVDGHRWVSPTGEWCAIARTDAGQVQLAGDAIAPSDIAVRAVREWAPYGADLTQPQPASVLSRVAAAVVPAWESAGRSK